MLYAFQFLVFLVSLFFLLETRATELRQPYRSIAAMGMGGVEVPFPIDEDAVIVNPAALPWVTGFNLDLIHLDTSLNKETIPLIATLKAVSQPSDLNILFGKPIWASVKGKASLTVPYFGVAGYISGDLALQMQNPVYPQLNVTYIKDQVMMAGFAVPLGPLISLGLSGKQINRIGGNKDVSVGLIGSGNNLQAIADQFQDQGVGYGMDAALMARIPAGILDSRLTMVWHDVGSTQFTQIAGSGAPDRQKDNLIFGAGTTIDLPGIDLKGGIEYRHITLQGEQLGKKIHLGGEISLPLIDIRIGANQGYTSYGVGTDLFLFKFDAAMITEELGEYAGQMPQTRYMAGISMSLGFDADFKFTNENGRRRKVKQRR